MEYQYYCIFFGQTWSIPRAILDYKTRRHTHTHNTHTYTHISGTSAGQNDCCTYYSRTHWPCETFNFVVEDNITKLKRITNVLTICYQWSLTNRKYDYNEEIYQYDLHEFFPFNLTCFKLMSLFYIITLDDWNIALKIYIC